MNMIHEVQRSFTDIILGGVMMRFPKFKLVSAENDTGWLPHYMYRLDHAFEKWGVQMAEPLEMKPSEYIRRQLWATFQDDPVGPMTWQFFGRDNYMWASDFPHTDSTWPHSQEVIAKNFAGIPEEVTRKDHLRQRRQALRHCVGLRLRQAAEKISPQPAGSEK